MASISPAEGGSPSLSFTFSKPEDGVVPASAGAESVRAPAASSLSAAVGAVAKGVMPVHRTTAGDGDEETRGGVTAAFGAGGGEATRPCSMSLSSSFEVDDDIIVAMIYDGIGIVS